MKINKKQILFFSIYFVVIPFLVLGFKYNYSQYYGRRWHKAYEKDLNNIQKIIQNLEWYQESEKKFPETLSQLWPSQSDVTDPESYMRKQLRCPESKKGYKIVDNKNFSKVNAQGYKKNLPLFIECEKHGNFDETYKKAMIEDSYFRGWQNNSKIYYLIFRNFILKLSIFLLIGSITLYKLR